MKNFFLAVESLTVDEEMVAKMLGVSREALRSYMPKGNEPDVRIGIRVLFSREDLVKFVKQRSRRKTSG